MKGAKLSPNIGAEVTGIDLRNPLDAETRRNLNAAAVSNIALVIRGQDFTPEQSFAAVALSSKGGDTALSNVLQGSASGVYDKYV